MSARADAVLARVVLARRALAAARAGETALVALAAGTAAVAAAVASGAPPGAAEVPLVAALSALCGGAAYWLDRRPRAERVARALDRRLGYGGALTTAYEAELRVPERPLVRALSARVARRLSPREAVRAVLPSPLPLLVLPFLAAGWLALALDAARRPPPSLERLAGRAALALAGALAPGAEDAAVPAGALTPRERARLEDLARRLGAIAAAAREGRPEAARLVEEASEELAALREDLPLTPELARALERAGAELGTARRALSREVERARSRRPADSEPAAGGDAAGPGGTDGVPTERRDGMMSGLEPPPAAPEEPSEADAGAAALVLGPAPPERYAGVVAAWLELRRGAGGDVRR